MDNKDRKIPEEMYKLNADEFIKYIVDTFVGNQPLTQELQNLIDEEIYRYLKKTNDFTTEKPKVMTDDERIEIMKNIDSNSLDKLDDILNSFEDWLYEVEITLNTKDVEETKEFLREKLDNYEIVNIDKNVATLHWNIDVVDGPHEIENLLHYVLENGKLGTYTYKSID